MAEVIRNSEVIPVECYVCGQEIKDPIDHGYLCFHGRIYRLCLEHEDVFVLTIYAMNKMKGYQVLAKGVREIEAKAEEARGGVS